MSTDTRSERERLASDLHEIADSHHLQYVTGYQAILREAAALLSAEQQGEVRAEFEQAVADLTAAAMRWARTQSQNLLHAAGEVSEAEARLLSLYERRPAPVLDWQEYERRRDNLTYASSDLRVKVGAMTVNDVIHEARAALDALLAPFKGEERKTNE